MKCLVLAGGLGTRLRSAVPELPKPMAPVNGRPFLEFVLDHWIEQGIDQFVLSVGYKWEAFKKHFGDSYQRARISYSIEEAPLGTGGAVLQAIQSMGDKTFLLINGDTYFGFPLKPLSDFHQNRKSDFTMALRKLEAGKRYNGVVLDDQSRIQRIAKKGEGGSLINGGVALVEPSFFEQKFNFVPPVSFDDDVLPALIPNKMVYGFPIGGQFIDIGIPEDYRAAERLLSTSSR